MRPKITKKHLDYLVLLAAVVVAIALTVFFSSNKQLISIIVISLSVFYFFWGIIHHKFENSLRSEVVFEYFIFSLLGACLIIGLI